SGDLLTAGYASNYRPEVVMNHIYFTSLLDAAGLAAEEAVLRFETDDPSAQPHAYEVEPTAEFEDDPNVTDKKLPGNPTRSYRSTAPLRVIGEITDGKRLSPAELQLWRQRLSAIADVDSKQKIN